jgi:hypothetical protein
MHAAKIDQTLDHPARKTINNRDQELVKSKTFPAFGYCKTISTLIHSLIARREQSNVPTGKNREVPLDKQLVHANICIEFDQGL